ncbi:MAG TPA: hypothetical protein PLA05_01660 [bacterium]|nr:hypothetical protein [bacterium]HPY99342.1 hypothetical protein [bacterium]
MTSHHPVHCHQNRLSNLNSLSNQAAIAISSAVNDHILVNG